MKNGLKKLNQRGFDHFMVIAFIAVFGVIGGIAVLVSHAATVNSMSLHMTTDSGPCIAGTTIQNCIGSPAQTWVASQASNFHLENGLNQCLDNWDGDIHTSATDAHGFIAVSTCQSNDTKQEWNWNGTLLVNEDTQGCLNAKGDSIAPGTPLIVYACESNSPNEQWLKVTTTTSSLTGNPGNLTPGKSFTGAFGAYDSDNSCLEQEGTTSGAAVARALTCTNLVKQKWSMVQDGYSASANGAPQYTIRTYQSSTGGLCLDNWQAKNANNNPIKLYTCDGTSDPAEQWVRYGSNNDQLMNPATNKCLDVLNGTGMSIDLYQCKASDQSNQEWAEVPNSASATPPAPSSPNSNANYTADLTALLEELKANHITLNCSTLSQADQTLCTQILGS